VAQLLRDEVSEVLSHQAAWLLRAGRHISGTERDSYAELLNRVRRRGWSLSLGNDQHTQLLHAIDGYSAGDLSLRANVQRLGSELVHRVEPAELDPSTVYDIRPVSAPVFGPDGSVALMLTLWGLPHPSTGADLSRYLDVVSAAARRITDTLGGSGPVMVG
jgi:DNA-binding IclR family transcriptional regulator